jgi:hypothetical protein
MFMRAGVGVAKPTGAVYPVIVTVFWLMEIDEGESRTISGLEPQPSIVVLRFPVAEKFLSHNLRS